MVEDLRLAMKSWKEICDSTPSFKELSKDEIESSKLLFISGFLAGLNEGKALA